MVHETVSTHGVRVNDRSHAGQKAARRVGEIAGRSRSSARPGVVGEIQREESAGSARAQVGELPACALDGGTWLSVDEAVEAVSGRTSAYSIYRAIAKGRLRAIKVGGRISILGKWLKEWLADCNMPPVAPTKYANITRPHSSAMRRLARLSHKAVPQ